MKFNLSLILILFSLSLYAQERNYQIQKAKGKIALDGQLDESDWQIAETTGGFQQQTPYDTSLSVTKTEVKMTYDDKFIYVGAICYDTFGGDYIIRSLIRDFSYPANDAFAIYLDPFGDQTNGFNFTVSPMGVQREGLIANNGRFGVTTSWDNRWFSEVKRYHDRWIVEMAIPFKSIRYKEGSDTWRVNFSRNNLKINENSAWSPVPRNFNVASLGFTGILKWDASPKKAGNNISIIPYTLLGTDRNYQSEEKFNLRTNVGGDAKIAVTSSLNLDLTFNPDFSQVEVDQQQTNLTRFELNLPEKRQFFIENSDLFGNFGFSRIRPFFSRRIGISQGMQVPILAGARLSGKVNKNWRVGLMDIQTEGVSELNLASQNYFVGAVQRRIFDQSNIGLIVVNKQGFKGYQPIAGDYNTIVGLDYKLTSNNNKWSGIFFYHKSFTNEKLNDNKAHASFLAYNTRNLAIAWNHEYVGNNYIAEVGFVPRLFRRDTENDSTIRFAYWRLEPSAQYTFYPKTPWIIQQSFKLYLNNYYDINYNISDEQYQQQYNIVFSNTSSLTLTHNNFMTRLLFPVDITRTGTAELPKGKYYYENISGSYSSDNRKLFSVEGNIDWGTFFNGHKTTYGANVNYRLQPLGVFTLGATRNLIELPDPYGTTDFLSINLKTILSFNKKLFLRNYLQYNVQLDNISVNCRLQWRFKPLSDLYIVYTDNYDPTSFYIKNRALIAKLIYWFTV